MKRVSPASLLQLGERGRVVSPTHRSPPADHSKPELSNAERPPLHVVTSSDAVMSDDEPWCLNCTARLSVTVLRWSCLSCGAFGAFATQRLADGREIRVRVVLRSGRGDR